jgi:hypothetical protein
MDGFGAASEQAGYRGGRGGIALLAVVCLVLVEPQGPKGKGRNCIALHLRGDGWCWGGPALAFYYCIALRLHLSVDIWIADTLFASCFDSLGLRAEFTDCPFPFRCE